jgi:hypothetical protein
LEKNQAASAVWHHQKGEVNEKKYTNTFKHFNIVNYFGILFHK